MSSDKTPLPQYEGHTAPGPVPASQGEPLIAAPSPNAPAGAPPQYHYSSLSSPEPSQQGYHPPPQHYTQQHQYAAPVGYQYPPQQAYQVPHGQQQFYNGNQGYAPPTQQYGSQHQAPGQSQQGQYYGYMGQPTAQHQYAGSPYPSGAPQQPQNLQYVTGNSVVVVRQQPAPFPNWRVIMLEGLFGCTDDCGTFMLACCIPSCIAGHNQGRIGKNCFFECLFYVCCAGCQRSSIQNVLGVPDSGCCLNCCLHYHCGPCALAQESRALDAWINAGRPPAVPSAVIVSV